jgi:type I restriction enzyme M protein
MKPVEKGGTRLAIVFNASPLFTGSAGSGESEIRRWIIENDWLEAIVALPTELFYNTGINTYIWIVTNRKEKNRKGKIQLIDASSFFSRMRKSLGNKRNEIDPDSIDEITRIYGEFKETQFSKILTNLDFGFQHVTVERPLRLNFAVNNRRLVRVQETSQFQKLATSKKRKNPIIIKKEIEQGKQLQRDILKALEKLLSDIIIKDHKQFAAKLRSVFKAEGISINAALFKAILRALSERDQSAPAFTDKRGNEEPDKELRDYEDIPLTEEIDAYFDREVLPYVPDAWIDKSKTKIGYEIDFNRYFYKYVPLRPIKEIEVDLRKVWKEIKDALKDEK